MRPSWLLLNAAVVALFVVGAILFAVVLPGVGVKWFLLAALTVLTFAAIVGVNRQRWNLPMFWAVIALLCVLHVGAYASLLWRVEKWPGPLFVAIFVAEVIGLNAVVGYFPATCKITDDKSPSHQ
ncbi:MAG TPA: hypothetical protein VEG32_12265 [Clostridia bacterium]|nr:hypothetical protein [Clostridia bacterium]